METSQEQDKKSQTILKYTKTIKSQQIKLSLKTWQKVKSSKVLGKNCFIFCQMPKLCKNSNVGNLQGDDRLTAQSSGSLSFQPQKLEPVAAGGPCGSSTVWKHLRPTCGQPVGSGLRPGFARTSASHLSPAVELFNFSPPAGEPFLKTRLLYAPPQTCPNTFLGLKTEKKTNPKTLSSVCLASPQGLFRIAAGASKLKKLKAALDCSTSQLEEFYSDPHAVAG